MGFSTFDPNALVVQWNAFDCTYCMGFVDLYANLLMYMQQSMNIEN